MTFAISSIFATIAARSRHPHGVPAGHAHRGLERRLADLRRDQ